MPVPLKPQILPDGLADIIEESSPDHDYHSVIADYLASMVRG
jgi:hypothetical protein